MVFQFNDVHQYLPIRPNDGLFLFLVPFNRWRWQRMRFQKLIFYFRFTADAIDLVQRQTYLLAPAFCRDALARVVNQNVAHDLRSQAKKLGAMLH